MSRPRLFSIFLAVAIWFSLIRVSMAKGYISGGMGIALLVGGGIVIGALHAVFFPRDANDQQNPRDK